MMPQWIRHRNFKTGVYSATMGLGYISAPAVTVVMPVYNRQATVRRAIESVMQQSFGNFEFLIVDDASTDNTAAVIAEFDDPRIRYLRQPKNQGACAARNRGIIEARSPLVAFLDSDDCFLPRKLGYLRDYFGRQSDVDVLIDSHTIRYRPEKIAPTPIV